LIDVKVAHRHTVDWNVNANPKKCSADPSQWSNFMKLKLIAVAIAVSVASAGTALALDLALPPYQPIDGVSGQLKSVGSDTLNTVMESWAKGFEAHYLGLKIEIEGKGSATGPTALLEGGSQFGPMSRAMMADEVDAFEKKFGYPPDHFHVAVDALPIYVNKDNPIQCLTEQQRCRRDFGWN
jgi:phosphate transport system substrate-binding protein